MLTRRHTITFFNSNQFFDKFEIRYHLQLILRHLWLVPLHRGHIDAFTHNPSGLFLHYISLLANDIAFILDEV